MNYIELCVFFLVLCSELNATELMKNRTEGNSDASAVILKIVTVCCVRTINCTAGLIIVYGNRHTGRCQTQFYVRHVFVK
jgi:hypothetical protein